MELNSLGISHDVGIIALVSFIYNLNGYNGYMYINTGCLNIKYIIYIRLGHGAVFLLKSTEGGYLFDILLNRTAECKHKTLVPYYISIFFHFFFAALVISLLYQGRFLAVW